MSSEPAARAAVDLPKLFLFCQHGFMVQGGGLPAWFAEEPEELQPILLELRELRTMGFGGLRSSTRVSSIPILLGIAHGLYPNARPGSNYEPMRILFREKILILFNDDEKKGCAIYFDYDEKYGSQSTKQRRAEAAWYFGKQGDTKFRDPAGNERPFLINIANAIFELHQNLSRSDSKSDSNYVRRDALHDEIKKKVDESCRIVALVGEGGTGKTTLSEGFATEEVGREHVVKLRAHNQDVFFSDIVEELDRLHVSTSGLASLPVARITLRKLLVGELAMVVQFLIIDNVTDWDLIAPLLEKPLTPVVILTMRSELLPKGTAAYVSVGSLTLPEAKAMITYRLTDATSEEVDMLSRLLRGRAVVIEHVCAFLDSNPTYRQDGFIAVLERKLVPALDDIAGSLNTTALKTIYREIIDMLRASDETARAVALLELVVFTSGQSVPSEVVGIPFIYSIKEGRDLSTPVSYVAAKDVLQRHHLIQEEKSRTSEGWQISVHPLTQEILQHIFFDFGNAICNRLIHGLIGLGRLITEDPTSHAYLGEETTQLFLYCVHLHRVVQMKMRLFAQPEHVAAQYEIYKEFYSQLKSYIRQQRDRLDDPDDPKWSDL